MKKRNVMLGFIVILCIVLSIGCGKNSASVSDKMTVSVDLTNDTSEEVSGDIVVSTDSMVASADEMVTPEDIVDPSMVPVDGSKLNDGVYEVTVDSSSSMFRIVACSLTVTDGNMTAVMTMSGTGYRYLYMGTGEEALTASEDSYIPFVADAEGAHTYTVPVSALDAGIDCTAFSDNKEKWYDRILVFRADSLPLEAWKEAPVAASGIELELADGEYQANVTLSGGSGRASVESPTVITVTDGVPYATIIWSSCNFDYMLVDDEKYLNENTEGNSTFTIPVLGFSYEMPVIADTTAMSTPHEVEYTLYFEIIE